MNVRTTSIWCCVSPLLLVPALSAGCSAGEAAVVPDPSVAPATSDAGPNDESNETPSTTAKPDDDAGVRPVDAGGAASPVGTWELVAETYVWQSDYAYELHGDGTLVIRHQRLDRNGARADCLQHDRATGTWTVNGDVLNVEADEGRTIRNHRVNAGQCGLGKDWSYAERDMTADELKLIDFADGKFVVDGDLLSTTDVHGIKWNWSRKN
jgi:hypothetical protein